MSCEKCMCGKYCSRKCLETHKNHSDYCAAICTLEEIEFAKRSKVDISGSDAEKLPLRMKLKLIRLVGERPLVDFCLNGKIVEGLWDTGSMISLVSRKFLKEQFPGVEIHSVEDFLENKSLNLTAANNSEVSVDGVVILNFGVEPVADLSSSASLFQVPFLVASESISRPIIGYNIIEHLVTNFKDQIDLPVSLVNIMKNLSPENAESMINLVEAGGKISEITSEVALQKTEKILPGALQKIRCKIKKMKFNNCQNKIILFSPFEELLLETELVIFDVPETIKMGKKVMDIFVYNPTAAEIVVNKGLVIGEVSDVASAFTFPMFTETKNAGVQEIGVESTEAGGEVKEKFDLEHLELGEREVVLQMLKEEEDVFSKSKNDIGHIKDFKLKIEVMDNIPVNEAYRRIPRQLYAEVKDYISNLLANGWVRESHSPYSSPMVCVRKKDGGLRLCCDFRKLNKITIPDRQPIPRIQDMLDGLGGSKWYSTLDMSQAYHQGEMDEPSRKFTAFSTPWSLYEWIRIPYGITNAPPAFQRFINNCLAKFKDTICNAYLDDILVYTDTFESHVESLRKILKCLKGRGVKLNLSKCHLVKREVRYLGRLISENGYRPDPENTKALEKCKVPPKNIGELRTLLGFLGYFRTYVKDFSRKLKSVYDLLQIKDEKKSEKKQSNKRLKIEWTQKHQKIIEEMVEYLQSPQVISYPEFGQPFTIHCDASNEGLGAVLYQKIGKETKIISFASRTLTPAERNYNYHSGKLEFLALKWAISDKFSDYLVNGPDFEVVTDNNPLTYLLTTAKLNASGLRWVNRLADFNFSVKYRSGKKHVDADYLSRHPVDDLQKLEAECDGMIKARDVDVAFAGLTKSDCCVNQVSTKMMEVKDDVSEFRIEKEELQKAQRSDDVIGPVYRVLEAGVKMDNEERKKLGRESKILLKQMKKLSIDGDGVLVRQTKTVKQIVLPKVYHNVVFVELHEKLAHLAGERVLDLARMRFYWPRMQNHIDFYVRKQCRCLVAKRPNIPDRAPLIPIQSQYPFEMVSMDYLHLDRCKGGYEYALIVVDHFTRFVQVYPTKNKNAISAADKLYNEFILNFGFPRKIHHDQGKEFNNRLFNRLHQLAGITQSRTTPYHPMGDGQAERMNRTIINMLKTLEEKEKSNWKSHLLKLAFAYNATINKATRYSPYFLMFGREPRLPIDLMFGIEFTEKSKVQVPYQKFVEGWENSIKQAFEIVREHTKKVGETSKRYYDKKVSGTEIKVGDRVLLRNHRERGGTGKLRAYWEDTVYIVTDIHPDVPVYTIKPEIGKQMEKRVHRNNILNCNHLLLKNGNEKPDKSDTNIADQHGAARKKVNNGAELKRKEAVSSKKESANGSRLERSSRAVKKKDIIGAEKVGKVTVPSRVNGSLQSNDADVDDDGEEIVVVRRYGEESSGDEVVHRWKSRRSQQDVDSSCEVDMQVRGHVEDTEVGHVSEVDDDETVGEVDEEVREDAVEDAVETVVTASDAEITLEEEEMIEEVDSSSDSSENAEEQVSTEVDKGNAEDVEEISDLIKRIEEAEDDDVLEESNPENSNGSSSDDEKVPARRSTRKCRKPLRYR